VTSLWSTSLFFGLHGCGRLGWLALAQKRRLAASARPANADPRAAAGLAAAGQTQAEVLKASSEMGRPGRLRGKREWVVQRAPYLLVYRIGAGRNDILRMAEDGRLLFAVAAPNRVTGQAMAELEAGKGKQLGSVDCAVQRLG